MSRMLFYVVFVVRVVVNWFFRMKCPHPVARLDSYGDGADDRIDCRYFTLKTTRSSSISLSPIGCKGPIDEAMTSELAENSATSR